jgi:hypothetical protein
MTKRLTAISMVFIFGAVMGYAGDKAAHALTLTVSDTCRLALNSTAGVSLETSPPAAGGAAPTGNTDATKALRYTSLVPSGGSRKITANWDASDATPAGTSLLLQVTNVPPNCGTAAGQIRLSGEPQVLIANIGSCSTGPAGGQAGILYRFNIDDVTSLVTGDTRTVNVSFTLTDAS